MDTSEKQRETNRINGAFGGVKTERGKEVSSKNATKHGVLARFATRFDPLNIDEIYAELIEEFGDTSPSRRILIQQLALTVVRLSRCSRAETDLIREALNPRITEVQGGLPDLSFGTTVVVSEGEPALITSESLEKFALIYERYEPRLVSRLLLLIQVLKVG